MLIDAGVFLVRLLVGGVFLVAGLAKARAPSSHFLKTILGYDLLPKPVAAILARGLPWLEIMTGGMLVLGLWTRFAAILGTGLFLVFSGAVVISLLRGKDQACGCFHSLTPVQWRLVYRNLTLMGLLLPIYAVKDTHFQLSMGLISLATVWLLALSIALLFRFVARQRTVNSASL